MSSNCSSSNRELDGKDVEGQTYIQAMGLLQKYKEELLIGVILSNILLQN